METMIKLADGGVFVTMREGLYLLSSEGHGTPILSVQVPRAERAA